ncbi:NACHT, LRR and PYD domains-containing protein 13 [Suricata suricatta]|uniref:NACHT, LRR and PYD domains-containing protein 13 n=1 Tax=Suricata suricatta TaxID=37032 RepID=UPI0011556D0A|nr:NACHT, LRR and PYD domains-containing protein 13 [Suricata suricatta]
MSSSANIYVEGRSYNMLLSYLMGLGQSQLEEFKVCLQSSELLLGNFRKIPWANLKAIDPVNLLCLLREYFSERQLWEVTLAIFENMNLTSWCMEVRAVMNEMAQVQGSQDPSQEEPEAPEGEAGEKRKERKREKAERKREKAERKRERKRQRKREKEARKRERKREKEARKRERKARKRKRKEEEKKVYHRRRYRESIKAKILTMWDNIPWPEDHIYLRNMTEKEHEELKSLLYPSRTGAQPKTVVLEGPAGVGKTTLAMKAVLHWAEGFLFQQTFSYVFFISCHKVKEMKDTSLAGLLSWDWPDSQPPIEELMGYPERLLFVIDGFEEMDMPSNLDDSPPYQDWYQQLPVNRILFYLLKKELVPQATLLITTKEYRTNDLKNLLLNPWFVQILGFTEGDREEYFIRYFGDQSKAKKILHWVRKNDTLFHFCSAPMVCWTVCSCLQRQMARSPHFQLSTQTTTSLYVYFFSSLFATAEVTLSDQRWPEQWRALCSLAAEGMWVCKFTFAKKDLKHRSLEDPVIGSLLRWNILRKVSDCEDCVTFTHQSFQVFLGAMFYVLRGTRGSAGGPLKHQEMKVLLNDTWADTNLYWRQMALFVFGLLKRNLAEELEETLHCKMSPKIMDELLEWAEELESYNLISNCFEFLHFFECLYETREENFVRQILSPLLEVDLDIFGNLQLQVSSFCLKHCQRLNKLRLSVSGVIPQTEVTFNLGTLETRPHSKIGQWQEVCSVFSNGNLSDLDLSNSRLNTYAMKKLCYELRNPRCKLHKLTCKSVTPVRILKELVLVLHGNHRLTHLNLSSNHLGIPVSTMIFKTLRHSACNLQYLWLESCGLTPLVCRHLFLELSKNSSVRFLSLGDNDLSGIEVKSLPGPSEMAESSLRELSLERCSLSAAGYQRLAWHLTGTQRTTRLCLGFNPLRDDGVRLLCASLTHPQCALERLVLWLCQLGAPGCRYLSDALLENQSLTHLNLRRNDLRDEGVKLLCKALSRPDCSLRNLDLSNCSFTAEGCQELANALQHNHNVHILDIGSNDVQDDGVKHLCEVLKHPNCALNTLGLEKCNLTSASCQHLSSVLRSSKSLLNLNLLENNLEPRGVTTLWKALKKPTCKLQKLGLEKELYNIVKGEFEKLQERGSFLRVKCKWDFNDLEDKWWW